MSSYIKREKYDELLDTYQKEVEALAAKLTNAERELFELRRETLVPMASAANFMIGVACACLMKGILRASKGHLKPFGTKATDISQWTAVEIATAFSATDRIIERLELAMRVKDRAAMLRYLMDIFERGGYACRIEAQNVAQKEKLNGWRRV